MKKLLFILLLTIPFIGFGQVDTIKTYHENGKLKSEGILKDGKLEGIWKSYYKNGQLNYEWNYKEGELISQKCWDENGNKIECE